jgi:hypothetical protein
MTNNEDQFEQDARDLAALRDLSPEEWEQGCTALAREVFPDENWDDVAESA